MSKKAPIANVPCSCGRTWLNVCGFAVAMQGDVCRDDVFVDPDGDTSPFPWDTEQFEHVAARVNEEVERRVRAAFEAGYGQGYKDAERCDDNQPQNAWDYWRGSQEANKS